MSTERRRSTRSARSCSSAGLKVGPGFLQAIGESGSPIPRDGAAAEQPKTREHVEGGNATVDQSEVARVGSRPFRWRRSLDELLAQARREDAAHRMAHQSRIRRGELRRRDHTESLIHYRHHPMTGIA